MWTCATVCYMTETEQDVVAADDESSFTFDVDGLSDEALDSPAYPLCMLSCVRRLARALDAY